MHLYVHVYSLGVWKIYSNSNSICMFTVGGGVRIVLCVLVLGVCVSVAQGVLLALIYVRMHML